MGITVQPYGNNLKVIIGNDVYLCYPTSGGLWIAAGGDNGGPGDGGGDGDGSNASVTDTLLPGHHITNPGGTVNSGWQWHIDNSGRGGDDLSYNFENIIAPADGTLTHFDVSGVGMIIKLVLDTPVPRTGGTLQGDASGNMKAIFFEHCSHAETGHVNRGDVLGISGDGYGQYPAHLHVHGKNNTNNSTVAAGRQCFWKFL